MRLDVAIWLDARIDTDVARVGRMRPDTRGSSRGRDRVSGTRMVWSWVKILRIVRAERPFSNAVIDVARHRRLRSRRDGLATTPHTTPEQRLRHAVRRASAGRADPLVVLHRTVRDVVPVTQSTLDLDQIFDVHPGAERVAAAPTGCRLACPTGILIEAHTKLRRSLDDVEELAEGQPQERPDDRDRMDDRDERIRVPFIHV